MIDTKELRRLAHRHSQCALSIPVKPAAIFELLDRLEAAEKERDALRAKVAEMEKQEPVAFVLNAPKLKRCAALLDAGKKLPHKTKLYALPGAQGE